MKLIRNKSFTSIFKGAFTKGQLKFNVKYMLKQAHGRLNRLMKHFKSNAQIIRNNKELLEMDLDLQDMTRIELASMLSKLNKFTQSESSTIKGYKESRQKTIDAFNENGYEWVNEDNLDDMLEFLDDFKEGADSQQYGSGDALLMFEQADRLGISSDDLKSNMDLFMDNFKQIKNLDVETLHKDYGEELTSRDIANALGIKY